MFKCNTCRKTLEEGKLYRLIYINGKEEWVCAEQCYDPNLLEVPKDYAPFIEGDPD